MSIACMTRVWEWSLASGTELLCLLAIADHADDAGTAYPGIPSLARKTRMSERGVQKILRRLEQMGELEVRKNAGPKGTNLYVIKLDGGEQRSPVRGERRSPVVNPRSPGGVNAGSPEPSVEPSITRDSSVSNETGAAPSVDNSTTRPTATPRTGPQLLADTLGDIAGTTPDPFEKRVQRAVSEVRRVAWIGEQPPLGDNLTVEAARSHELRIIRELLRTVSDEEFEDALAGARRMLGDMSRFRMPLLLAKTKEPTPRPLWPMFVEWGRAQHVGPIASSVKAAIRAAIAA